MATDPHSDVHPLRGSIVGKGLNPAEEIEAIREAVVMEIDAQIAELERQLAAIQSVQIENSGWDAVNAIREQISLLDGQKSIATHGSISLLVQLSRVMPAMITNAQLVSSHAVNEAAIQNAHLVFEMTDHQVHALQARHDQQASHFRQYEERSSSRIEQLAAQNGADVSTYEANRKLLLAQRDHTLATGDRVGAFRTDALLATNNVHGLVTAGGNDDEVSEARDKAAAARQRYLDEVAIQARKEAKTQGLNPDQAALHIANARSTAAESLDEEQRRLGIHPDQVASTQDRSPVISLTNTAIQTEERRGRNMLLDRDVNSANFRLNAGQPDSGADIADTRKTLITKASSLDSSSVADLDLSGAVPAIQARLEFSEADPDAIEKPSTPVVANKPDGPSVA